MKHCLYVLVQLVYYNNKIAENLLKSGRSIKFTRSISFTQGEHHQLSIKTKNITNSANKENDKMKTAYKKSESENKLKKNLKYTES